MKTVITFGTFDLFHIGHLNILERASRHGDRLVVGVSSDELNLRKKNFRPLFPLRDRMRIVEALSFVQEVFVEESLELKPDYVRRYGAGVLVMGHDWSGKFDFLRDLCDVVYLPRTQDISTSLLKERIKHPI